MRFIAATNIDLKAAVAAGRFRDDLFYRLNVLHVRMPALRERPEDVPALLELFLRRYGGTYSVVGITPAAHQALCAYDYPGNVRQLEHIIQRGVTIAQGPLIDVPDLPEELFEQHCEGTLRGVSAARDRAERDEVVTALDRNKGDLLGAARALHVSRTTLWRKIRKYDLATATSQV